MIVGVDVVLQFYTQYMMIFAEIEQDDRTENEIQRSLNDWLVVSNIFSIIYGEQSFPTDELICFKMDFQWDFRDWTVINTCCCFFCLIFIVTKKVYWLILSIIYIQREIHGIYGIQWVQFYPDSHRVIYQPVSKWNDHPVFLLMVLVYFTFIMVCYNP